MRVGHLRNAARAGITSSVGENGLTWLRRRSVEDASEVSGRKPQTAMPTSQARTRQCRTSRAHVRHPRRPSAARRERELHDDAASRDGRLDREDGRRTRPRAPRPAPPAATKATRPRSKAAGGRHDAPTPGNPAASCGPDRRGAGNGIPRPNRRTRGRSSRTSSAPGPRDRGHNSLWNHRIAFATV